jgi:hypothetical protein
MQRRETDQDENTLSPEIEMREGREIYFQKKHNCMGRMEGEIWDIGQDREQPSMCKRKTGK